LRPKLDALGLGDLAPIVGTLEDPAAFVLGHGRQEGDEAAAQGRGQIQVGLVEHLNEGATGIDALDGGSRRTAKAAGRSPSRWPCITARFRAWPDRPHVRGRTVLLLYPTTQQHHTHNPCAGLQRIGSRVEATPRCGSALPWGFLLPRARARIGAGKFRFHALDGL